MTIYKLKLAGLFRTTAIIQNKTNSENGHFVFSIFKKKQATESVIFRLYSKDIGFTMSLR